MTSSRSVATNVIDRLDLKKHIDGAGKKKGIRGLLLSSSFSFPLSSSSSARTGGSSSRQRRRRTKKNWRGCRAQQWRRPGTDGQTTTSSDEASKPSEEGTMRASRESKPSERTRRASLGNTMRTRRTTSLANDDGETRCERVEQHA